MKSSPENMEKKFTTQKISMSPHFSLNSLIVQSKPIANNSRKKIKFQKQKKYKKVLTPLASFWCLYC